MSQPNKTWEHWVDSHYELLLSRARVLFRGNTGKASDFLHDLLLELRRKWTQIENPLGWISTTMRYRVADYLGHANAPKEAATTETPAPEAVDMSLLMDIESAIARLPGKQQTVMTLFLEGNGIPEIAFHTGLSTDAVYQRLSRARKRMKQFLGDRIHEQGLQSHTDKAFTFSS